MTTLHTSSFKLKKRESATPILLIVGLTAVMVTLLFNQISAVQYGSQIEIKNVKEFEQILKEYPLVAIMFEGPKCPYCKLMKPYWVKLSESGLSNVKIYAVMFNPETQSIFMKYNIEETPTFILFRNGKPIAIHVGAFSGDVFLAMKSWIEFNLISSKQLSPKEKEGYNVYMQKCAKCHGQLDPGNIQAWIKNNQADKLVSLVAEAIDKGQPLTKLYPEKELIDKILSMKRFGVNVNAEEAKLIIAFFNKLTLPSSNTSEVRYESVKGSSQLGQETKRPENPSWLAWFIVGLAAGVATAFSPCVLPLFVTYIAANKLSYCPALAVLGFLGISALFVFMYSIAVTIQSILLPLVGALIVAVGLGKIMGVELESNTKLKGKWGARGFCLAYGILALQCTLPIVLAALLSMTVAGIWPLIGLIIGVGVPLTAITFMADRLKRKLMTFNYKLVDLITSVAMIIAGIYLLAYSMGLF